MLISPQEREKKPDPHAKIIPYEIKALSDDALAARVAVEEGKMIEQQRKEKRKEGERLEAEINQFLYTIFDSPQYEKFIEATEGMLHDVDLHNEAAKIAKEIADQIDQYEISCSKVGLNPEYIKKLEKIKKIIVDDIFSKNTK
jgi:hypothetical protein